MTGAGGFIGGHLVARLVRDGAQVRAFFRYNSRNERGTLDWLDPRSMAEVEVVLGELRDVESVARAAEGVEVVFHLGAQIAIPYSYVNPRDYFETNVLGTLNVAQARAATPASSAWCTPRRARSTAPRRRCRSPRSIRSSRSRRTRPASSAPTS